MSIAFDSPGVRARRVRRPGAMRGENGWPLQRGCFNEAAKDGGASQRTHLDHTLIVAPRLRCWRTMFIMFGGAMGVLRMAPTSANHLSCRGDLPVLSVSTSRRVFGRRRARRPRPRCGWLSRHSGRAPLATDQAHIIPPGWLVRARAIPGTDLLLLYVVVGTDSIRAVGVASSGG